MLRRAPDDSVDAVVTDPPYGLKFMGKKWDYTVPSVETFAEIHRVLKDGGRMLCFAGTRTMHRMWVNIEDAGFTIEDTVHWMYGSGFPKHASKLKPACEPICVARKGDTSDLNIDACRVEYLSSADRVSATPQGRVTSKSSEAIGAQPDAGRVLERVEFERPELNGRWPANVVLDEEAAAVLDEQAPNKGASAPVRGDEPSAVHKNAYSQRKRIPGTFYGDSGGASRFFYCAKAARSEREAGLNDAPKQSGGSNAKGFTEDVARGQDRNRPVGNHHPTVKPVALMRWLVRLVSQPGDVVLDPFFGSGTTGIAATLEGRDFIGIDIDPVYVEMGRRRIEHWSTLK